MLYVCMVVKIENESIEWMNHVLKLNYFSTKYTASEIICLLIFV